MWPTDFSGLSTAFAVFVLCFCSHVNTTKITAELKYTTGKSKFDTKVKKSSRATITAYTICALSYFFVGVCGYMAFGNSIKGSILDSLENTDIWFKPVVRVGYGLVVLFSYPILGFPACNTIDSYIFKGERTLVRRVSQGFIWVMISFLLAVLIPQLEMIFGVTRQLLRCADRLRLARAVLPRHGQEGEGQAHGPAQQVVHLQQLQCHHCLDHSGHWYHSVRPVHGSGDFQAGQVRTI